MNNTRTDDKKDWVYYQDLKFMIPWLQPLLGVVDDEADEVSIPENSAADSGQDATTNFEISATAESEQDETAESEQEEEVERIQVEKTDNVSKFMLEPLHKALIEEVRKHAFLYNNKGRKDSAKRTATFAEIGKSILQKRFIKNNPNYG